MAACLHEFLKLPSKACWNDPGCELEAALGVELDAETDPRPKTRTATRLPKITPRTSTAPMAPSFHPIPFEGGFNGTMSTGLGAGAAAGNGTAAALGNCSSAASGGGAFISVTESESTY